MAWDASDGQGASAASQGPLPPHAQLEDFLPEPERCALLDWALAQEARFKPAKVFYGEGGRRSRVDAEVRLALKLWDVGPFEPLLRTRLFEALPEIMTASGYRGEEPRSIEFELNAYGDGARFAPHRDIAIGKNRMAMGHDGEERVISAVYYFHGEPKGFSGGQLRLYRFGAEPSNPSPDASVALEPVQNSLVVFPPWAKHAVERVSCPSGRFADYRFGLNCWFCRPAAGGLA